jgi:hypothetical protein
MADKNDRDITTPKNSGFFQSLSINIRLVIRLMLDPRVNIFLKFIPFISVFYFLFPDIMPGPIDDAVIMGVSFYLFIELCPPEVVEEHMRELTRTIEGESRDVNVQIDDEEIVDAEYREM